MFITRKNSRLVTALLSVPLALALSACGGGNDDKPADTPTRVDLLLSNDRGMEGVSFDSKAAAYIPLYTAKATGSGVLRTTGALSATSTWQPVGLGTCALPAYGNDGFARAARLQSAFGALYLMQSTSFNSPVTPEHSQCVLDEAALTFKPQDQGLQTCYGTFCDILWANEMQAVGTRLYSNAGADLNLLASDDKGVTWRALLGRMESGICTHQAFHVLGNKVLVGGECPLDEAFIRAYTLPADITKPIDPAAKLPLTLPELENRNVQFITSVANGNNPARVYIGVEGGLLRSDDGGQSFKFVIKKVQADASYPYIGSFLSPAGKPNRIVVAGFDKATGKPYLAWTDNAGDTWTDISALLPGYQRAAGSEATSHVTGLAEDAQGRILLTVNEDWGTKGRLMLLTLGTR